MLALLPSAAAFSREPLLVVTFAICLVAFFATGSKERFAFLASRISPIPTGFPRMLITPSLPFEKAWLSIIAPLRSFVAAFLKRWASAIAVAIRWSSVAIVL